MPCHGHRLSERSILRESYFNLMSTAGLDWNRKRVPGHESARLY
jgi:hypothetical protein